MIISLRITHSSQTLTSRSMQFKNHEGPQQSCLIILDLSPKITVYGQVILLLRTNFMMALFIALWNIHASDSCLKVFLYLINIQKNVSSYFSAIVVVSVDAFLSLICYSKPCTIISYQNVSNQKEIVVE